MRVAIALMLALLLAACGQSRADAEILVGAVYPLSGPQALGGHEELGGVKAALELSHAHVRLDVVSALTPSQATAAVDRLVDQDHVQAIIGAYGSTLAVAAAARADQRHVVYWETGAVADDVTDHRSYVFRTVATGSTLGRTAAQFTAQVLIPKLGLTPAQTRVAIVHTDDFYGRSVAGGEQETAKAVGIGSVSSIEYNPNTLDPAAVVAQVAAARPDFLWDVSYLDDGVAVWREVLAEGVRLKAAIGTSSAFCLPQFQQDLGSQALGVYAADKPDQVIAPDALTPAARTQLAQAIAQFGRDNAGQPMEIPGVAGFVGGWTLFHDVLGQLKGTVTSDAIRAAAYNVNVPVGGEINGAGIKFAPAGSADAGQNLRAAAVVGQWQAGGVMAILYPAAYATGAPDFSDMP